MNITHSATGASQERALPLQQPGFPGYKILIMKSLQWRADMDSRRNSHDFTPPASRQATPFEAWPILVDPPIVELALTTSHPPTSDERSLFPSGESD